MEKKDYKVYYHYYNMKFKKKTLKSVLFITLLIAIIVVGYFIYKNSHNNSEKICIADKKCFDSEIADTPEKMILGLSNRDSLDENKAMLFVFETEGIYGFWMKDMNFPLDIVWIDKNLEIVGIEKNLQPCETGRSCLTVYPDEEIIYVLEINSGLSDRYDFENGDVVHFG